MRAIALIHLELPQQASDEGLQRFLRRVGRPLLGLLQHHSNLRVGLSIPGQTLRRFVKSDPLWERVLRQLMVNKQVELLGGGWSNPDLTIIPRQDALSQLSRQRQWIEKRYEVLPQGAWLAGRRWDPELPSILNRAEVEYTFTPIEQFRLAGMDISEIWGPIRVPRRSSSVQVMPIHTDLATILRAESPEQAMQQELQRARAMGWEHWCWALTLGHLPDREELKHLTTCCQLQLSTQWLSFTLPGTCVRDSRPMVTRRLPGSIQPHPVDQYPEARWFLARGLHSSRWVSRLAASLRKHPERRAALLQAQDMLHSAQALLSLTHLPHLGIYDPHLREHTLQQLLGAESIALQAMQDSSTLERFEEDLDHDGVAEHLLTRGELQLEIQPAMGGGISLLSRGGRSLTNTMGRHHESYHRELDSLANLPELVDEDLPPDTEVEIDVQEPPTSSGLAASTDIRKLVVSMGRDQQQRLSFTEFFLDPPPRLAAITRRLYRDQSDFNGQPYKVLRQQQLGEQGWSIYMTREGAVGPEHKAALIQMAKRFSLHPDRDALRVDLRVTNRYRRPLQTVLGLEINLSRLPEDQLFFGEDLVDMETQGDQGEVELVRFLTPSCEMVMKFSTPLRIMHYPVDTLSWSNTQLARCRQGYCLTLLQPLQLWEKERWDLGIQVLMEPRS